MRRKVNRLATMNNGADSNSNFTIRLQVGLSPVNVKMLVLIELIVKFQPGLYPSIFFLFLFFFLFVHASQSEKLYLTSEVETEYLKLYIVRDKLHK